MRDGVDGITEYAPQLLVDHDLDPFSYTGNARFSQGFFDEAAALGHPVVLMVQETYSTRSQEGYQSGVYDAQFAEQRARERGWRGPIAYVVSDGNGADRWSSHEYARGIGDASTLGFYILGYGADGVLEDFAPGVRASAGASRLFLGTDGDGARWVPETWGPNNAIGQVVGPSPIPDTDLNHVTVELAPRAPVQEDDGMDLITTTDNGNTAWFRDAGGILVRLTDLEAVLLGALDPNRRRWNLGGWLAAVAWNVETIQARRALGLDAPLTDAQVAQVAQQVAAQLKAPALSDADVAKIVDGSARATVQQLKDHPLVPSGA